MLNELIGTRNLYILFSIIIALMLALPVFGVLKLIRINQFYDECQKLNGKHIQGNSTQYCIEKDAIILKGNYIEKVRENDR